MSLLGWGVETCPQLFLERQILTRSSSYYVGQPNESRLGVSWEKKLLLKATFGFHIGQSNSMKNSLVAPRSFCSRELYLPTP